MFLTNTQVSRLRQAFENSSSANTKLSKTQLNKIGQSGRLLGRLLGPLLKTGLPLVKNVLKPLAKRVLIPLGLTAAAATDSVIHEGMFGLDHPFDLASRMTTLIISDEEMNDTWKWLSHLKNLVHW